MKGFIAEEPMNTETLTSYFRPILYKFHDREAIVLKTGFRSIRISYLDLYDCASRMANWYQHNGLKKGDAVLLWAPNSPEWVAALLACSLTGVIAVPLDMRVKPEFVQYIAGETGAKAGIKSKFMSIESNLNWWDTQDLSRQIHKAPPIFKQPEITGDDILEIVYTSGTTAAPKGVILTNRNIVSNIASLSAVLSYDKNWKFLSLLPLSHMLEQTVGLFIPLFYGCTITYLRTRKSSTIVQAMQEEGITSVITVPLFLQTFRERILREVSAQGKEEAFNRMLGTASKLPRWMRRQLFSPVRRTFGSNMKFFAVGGAPLDSVVEDFWNNLGLKVLQGYGLTEASPLITCNTVRDPRPGTVGRVLPKQEIKLSSQGEILVKGANVTQGYYKQPVLTEQYFTEGWYKTGDVGEIDGDGFLRIKGRTKNMILTASGMNVYPEDIEAELCRAQGVKEACVLGIEQEGQTVIHAVLLLDESAGDAKAIIDGANVNLADHQKVQAFTVWGEPDFPRTTTLKVQRRFVKEALEKKVGKEAKTAAAESTTSPLYNIIASVSKVSPSQLKPSATLGFDLQLDSLARVELVGVIEEELGVELDETHVTDQTTIADIEELIASQKKVVRSKIKHWPLTPSAVLGRRILQAIFVRPLVRYYMKLRVMGKEKFDGLDKPFLLIANHISHLDAIVLTLALPWHVRKRLAVAAAADSFEEWDSSGASLKEKLGRKIMVPLAELCLNIFPFQRYAGIKKSLEYAGSLIDRGWSVMIFPEGRLSKDGRVNDFRSGIGLLVKELDVQVVPAKIMGVYEIMDYRFQWPQKHGEVTIRFGNPLGFSPDDTYEEIAKLLQHEVRFL